MVWYVCFTVAAVLFAVSVLISLLRLKAKYKSGSPWTPLYILFGGVIASALTLFIPLYMAAFKENGCGTFEAVAIAIHNVIRLFIVDVDFDFVSSTLPSLNQTLFRCYTVLFSVLFVVAPFLTFGFVLSFFKNVSEKLRYWAHFNSEVYIFSELNDKSLALATSIYNNDPKKRFIVFTDVFETEEERSYELIESAKELGAVCFKKDIVSLNFSYHSKKSDIKFFVIGADQSENITQALKIVEKMKYRDNTHLYVFSTCVESEMLLANAFSNRDEDIKIKVRRVNEVQSLILRNLYDKGFEAIFESAYDNGTEEKEINAVVIGMGQHGTEMTKALAWFCQMTGYSVKIDSFDKQKDADKRFTALCPELMAFSGKLDIDGEAKYTVNIHSNIDVDSIDFEKEILKIPRTTYAFIALGNDEKNVSTAVKLRCLFERLGNTPVIQAVVYNSDKKEALSDISNFKGQKYRIDFIGDMKTSYSEKVILDSEVENDALKRHLKWGDEREFWQFDYNYKSSVASAIHYKMKVKCRVPGIEKLPSDRTEDELWPLRILEHRRWNAYMRSEGYVYSGSVEKSSRNDLAKMHHCLVPFDMLSEQDKAKDDD